ncbi:MAG: histidine triad nucleotide-binding protein [Chloroflexia bacterium]|nr:histidine triad nucleotide-binding protein [Chloroflexia bacterium]
MSDGGDCIFCRIIRGDFGTEFVGESARAVAFQDVQPQAPVHLLVAPRRHVPALRDLGPDREAVAGELLALAADVAERAGLHDGGYRVVINDGPDAGQTVFHLHVHVLGGKRLSEPMG